MEFTEITEEVGHDQMPKTAGSDQCEECGAPLDGLQRYCVSCGARRLAVPDPAATYLAQASARARLRPRPAIARTRAGRRGPLTGTTALLALIAVLVAIGVGVLIGHATGGSNTAQLQKLSQQVAKLEAGGGGAGSASGSGTSSSGTASSGSSTSGGSTSASKGKSASSGVDNATGKSYLKKALNGPSSVSVP
jgi:hypothetical protein